LRRKANREGKQQAWKQPFSPIHFANFVRFDTKVKRATNLGRGKDPLGVPLFKSLNYFTNLLMRDIYVMKNLLFTLLFALGLFSSVGAQSAYHVHPNPSDTVTTMDTPDSPAHGEIKNVSNGTISVKWERHEIFLTSNITTAVCDPVTCWFPGVNTKTFQLDKDSMGQLTVHFYNAASDPAPGQAGSGIVHLKLTNMNNPADTLTAVYTYSTLTGTKDLPVANVKLFPNPTTDYFTLSNGDEVASMRVFALDGRVVARFERSPDNTYSIANLPVGNYVLSFEDESGQLFQAVEIHKQ
jgi:hypothetical protein